MARHTKEGGEGDGGGGNEAQVFILVTGRG